MIYLDYSATTPIRKGVREKIIPLLDTAYGNPSAVYALGRQAGAELKKARRNMAACLNVPAGNIIFTSGATESNNCVIHATVERFRTNRFLPHVITSPLEHPSVLKPLRHLENRGEISLTILPVNSLGRIDPDTLHTFFQKNTIMASVCAVSSEVGTIQPIHNIAAVCRQSNILLHSDFSQAMRCRELWDCIPHCDIVTASSHKNYGMKGAGFIIADKTAVPTGSILGGAQERGIRAGTENVPAAAGFAVALECLADDPQELRVKALRDRLHQLIGEKSKRFALIGDPICRADFHLSYIVSGVQAETFLIALDMAGICASSGSACSTGNRTVSEAVTAMGYAPEDSMNALRLTLGRYNTEEEIIRAADIIVHTAERLGNARAFTF